MVDYEDAHLLNMIHQNSKRDQPKWLGDSLLQYHYKALDRSILISQKSYFILYKNIRYYVLRGIKHIFFVRSKNSQILDLLSYSIASGIPVALTDVK